MPNTYIASDPILDQLFRNEYSSHDQVIEWNKDILIV